MTGNAGRFEELGAGALACEWRLGDGSRLLIWLNLSRREFVLPAAPAGTLVFCEPSGAEDALAARRLPACSAACHLEVSNGR
jgi:maltooligosyltrehalose trehalohydrolase